MEPNGQRLRQDQQQHEDASLNESSTTEVNMYHSVDDLMRKDAEQNPPPDSLTQRVSSSAASEATQAPKPWWRKLMGD